MMEKKIINIIIKATCSKSLQLAFKQTKFKITELDLLILAYKHAPTYDKRFEFFNLIYSNTKDIKIQDCVKKCIEFEEEKFNYFIKDELNCIFEVKIKERYDSYEECYLAKTYVGALNKIDYFKKHYSFVRLKDYSCIKIVKRRVVDDLSEDDFDEDYVGEAIFKGKSGLISVSHKEYHNVILNKAIKRIYPKIYDFTYKAPKLPVFLKHMDVVWFEFNGELKYAIVQVFEDSIDDKVEAFIEEDDDCAYCIVLSGEILNMKINNEEQFFNKIVGSHQHIEYPKINILLPIELPDIEKRVYNRVMKLFDKYKRFVV